MVENHSVVEQAHEIQALAKELEHFPCLLPDKFVVGGIIAKLPPSWRDFVTSLKHKRQELLSLLDLLMLRRGREQKTTVEKELSLPLLIWCTRKTHLHPIIKRRKTYKRTTIQSLSELLGLRRKTTRRVEVALFAGVMSIGQARAQIVNISKKRNQQTW